MEQQQEQLSGTVEKLIFQNQENGYTIFVLVMSNKTSTVVKSYLPAITPGEQVTLQGTWFMHPKFGRQFDAKSCVSTVPTSVIGLKKYLGSGLIKGIGPVYAEKLVNAFGLETLDIIDKEPDRLKEVRGIGTARVEKIVTAWQDQKEISHVMIFLQDKGISPAYATKIYKKYAQESIALVTENPYRLAEEIWGIGFKTADKIALNLNFQKDSIKRIRAGILYALSEHTGQGHLYSKLDYLKSKTAELLELNPDTKDQLLKMALHDLYNEDKIKLITFKDEHFIGLSQHYHIEQAIAQKIMTLKEHTSQHTFDIDSIYTQLRASNPGEVAYNEDQQRSILTCLQHKVSIITGGPGTGKTTTIKKLINILEQNNVRYKLAAPTGRAAKRISESTARPASTIHRLLEFDVSTFSFVKNEQNAMQLDFLIVDEASMLDIFLVHAILKAMPLHAYIVFIGDVDQLPSVGPGNVLNDLLQSEQVAHVRLQHIFRQAQNSMIIVNAHRINKGEFPIGPLPDAKKDFIFIKEQDPEKVPLHLQSIYTKELARFGISHHQAITLVPMHRGGVGTQKLNYDIQQLLNNDTNEHITHGGYIYKVHDRVMQIRNNYDKLVFNGDIGSIESIDKTDRLMQVRISNRIISYDFNELDELVLAYAISIHKSQGSEFDAAIIPIFMQHYTLLKRNLIYTAITRAKKLCIFIGQPKAIGIAISNIKDVQRITFLKQFLTTDLQCR